MVLLLGLKLENEDIDSVKENFDKIAALAQLVNDFPLPEEIEPAPVFEP
ncbi:MAG: DUF4089 domain-containing protein [Nostoc sp. RI_552]|nr:DUF4089 domain-containing protein [Nostoc sp. RI_552]